MLHVHSIHPNSRPDLFQLIEVTDQEESIPYIFVWKNHHEPHKKFKLVSKFAIKPTELETEAPKKQRNKKTVGLQENEESFLDIIKPQNKNDDDLANTHVDNFQSPNEQLMLETILKSTDCPLLPYIL